LSKTKEAAAMDIDSCIAHTIPYGASSQPELLIQPSRKTRVIALSYFENSDSESSGGGGGGAIKDAAKRSISKRIVR